MAIWQRCAAFGFALVSVLAGCGEKIDPVRGGDVPVACEPVGYESEVRPLLERRCSECHASSVASGGVALDSYERASANADRANARVQAGSMPPTGGLPDAERQLLAAWLAAGTPRVAEAGACAPDGGGSGDDVAGDDVAGDEPDLATAPDDVSGGDSCAPGVAWTSGIQGLLAYNCAGCHASSLAGFARNGAPMGVDFDTYAAAVASATAAGARIQAGTMPPGGGLPADSRAAFAAWLAAGLPEDPVAVCGAGDTSDGTPDVAATAEDVCGSGETWQRRFEDDGAEQGSPFMNPGMDCLACHARNAGAPRFAVAGTVFEHFAAPDLCYGAASAVVELTDADGKVIRLTANTAGNFYIESDEESLRMPVTARVLVGDKARAMSASQTSGSCNACHTVAGANGAPGRITVPR